MVRFICDSYAIPMPWFDSYAIPMRFRCDSCGMLRFLCDSYAVPMRFLCDSYAIPMGFRCGFEIFLGTPSVAPMRIYDSRITFQHFIFRELFLVIISSWFTSKTPGRIIFRNLSDLHLLPHLLRLMQSLHQKIQGGFSFL